MQVAFSVSYVIAPLPKRLVRYPHARLSVNLFVQPCEWFYAGAGAYGPELGDGFAGNHPFWIGEVGLQRAATAHVGAGRLALGVWQETAPVDRLDGGSRNGSTGFFSVGDQCVWREHPDSEADQQGAVIFYQYGWADRQVSAVAQHVAVGARWQGVVPGRDEDAVGIRYSWVQTSRVAGSGFSADETNWESFYRCQATRFIALTPNLQWIHHPGGQSRAARHADFFTPSGNRVLSSLTRIQACENHSGLDNRAPCFHTLSFSGPIRRNRTRLTSCSPARRSI